MRLGEVTSSFAGVSSAPHFSSMQAYSVQQHHHQLVSKLSSRPAKHIIIHHAVGGNKTGSSPSSYASGWEAFDDDDLSFMESIRPDSPHVTKTRTSSVVGTGKAHTDQREGIEGSHPSSPAPSWPPASRPTPPNRAAAPLGRPSHLRSPSAPSNMKPPVSPQKIFKDIDPLISVYASTRVSVMDPLEVSPEAPEPSASPTTSSPLLAFPLPLENSRKARQRSPLASFNDLSGSPYRYSLRLMRNMATSGLHLPTPIQQHAIPVINAGEGISKACIICTFCYLFFSCSY